MLYFNTDEERAARVEKMFEELHRAPKPLRPVTWILLTEPPGAVLSMTPVTKPTLTLVKSQS